MFRAMIEKLWWWLTHEHDPECTSAPDMNLHASERQYWHLHECRWCDRQWSVLNHDCAQLMQVQEDNRNGSR